VAAEINRGVHNLSTIESHTLSQGGVAMRVFIGVLGSLAIAVIAYNMGVSHGLAIGVPAAGGQYHPWGFGFFPFAPFLFIFFWFFLLRGLFWGGFHRRRWYYPGPYDVPLSFDEWHRRAHDRMSERAAPSEPEVR
jgi:hypothetical protein